MCDGIINGKLSRLAVDVDECLDRVARVECYADGLKKAEHIYISCKVDLESSESRLNRRLSSLEEMLLRDTPAVRFAKAIIELDKAVIDDTCILCGADFSTRTSHNPGCAIADAETYLNTPDERF